MADWILEHDLMPPVMVGVVFLLVIGLAAAVIVTPDSGRGGGDSQEVSDAPTGLVEAPTGLIEAPLVLSAAQRENLWPPIKSVLSDVQMRESSTPEQEVGTELHLNLEGGYGFRPPAGWEVTDDGAVSTLQRPAGDVVISFGLMSRGNLGEASDRLVASLQDAQGNTHIVGQQSGQIGGMPSLLVGGLGTNRSGLRVRFLAITIQGDPAIYAITIFVPADSNASKLLPPIERIVGSFRPSIPEDAAT